MRDYYNDYLYMNQNAFIMSKLFMFAANAKLSSSLKNDIRIARYVFENNFIASASSHPVNKTSML